LILALPLLSFPGRSLPEIVAHGSIPLVIDVFPPGRHDPRGIHAALAEEFGEEGFSPPADKPLTLAAYSAGELKRYYVEPFAVGDVLQDMPLFLTTDVYVHVPLEAAYLAAWAAVPRRWQAMLQITNRDIGTTVAECVSIPE